MTVKRRCQMKDHVNREPHPDVPKGLVLTPINQPPINEPSVGHKPDALTHIERQEWNEGFAVKLSRAKQFLSDHPNPGMGRQNRA